MAETRGGNGGSENGSTTAAGGVGYSGEAGASGYNATWAPGGGGGAAGSGVGGTGGTGGSGTPGTGGSGGSPNGANGGASGGGTDWSGGGGGQGGANGFTGASISTSAQGGNGGAGGSSNIAAGGGGAGGYGFVLTGTGVVSVSTNVLGGRGGDGGDNIGFGSGGEGGGGGGGIVVRDTGVSLNLLGTSRGGNGGTGGDCNYYSLAASDGRGGAGGDGVRGSSFTLVNSGTIVGGGGGGSLRIEGAGGSGVAGSNVSVELQGGGSISGGLSGNGLTRGFALEFTGGANTLTLTNGTAALTGGIGVTGGVSLQHGGTGATIANAISGSGTVTKTGTGTVTLSGTNTYTGQTDVQQGTLALNGGSAIADSGSVVVSNSAILDVNTNETVGSLGGTGSVQLDANLTTGGNNGSTTHSGVISGSGGLIKAGSGTMTLSATNTYNGATTVSGGTLLVNGSIASSAVTVQNSGTIGGSGTVGALTVQSGGAVKPGTSPGILNSGDFALNTGSSLTIEIGGTTVGTQYDQVNVTGSVKLGGSLSISFLSFAPTAGQTFTIINNDGTDLVDGTFSGLAQGATLIVGGERFTISYTGGTGNNDVVLTNFDPNTPPTQGANTGSTVAEGGIDTITSSELDFNDAEQGDGAITYTVTSLVNNGTLLFDGGTLGFGGTFTQADLANGRVTYQHDGGETTSASFGFSVSDGTATVTGQTFTFTVTPVNDAPTFTIGDGKVLTPVGSGLDAGSAVLVQDDGKPIVAGTASSLFGLVRYNTDGSLDSTFGTGSKVIAALPAGISIGQDAVLLDDGGIIVAGYGGTGVARTIVLMKFTPDGSLDTTFGSNGQIETPGFSVRSVAIASDGSIIVTGTKNDDLAVARFEADGDVDTTFGSNGFVSTAIAGNAEGRSVIIQPDGRIVVAGFSGLGAGLELTVVRYLSNGALDTSFSADGVVRTSVGAAQELGYDVALQADGKLVAVGGAFDGSQFNFMVVRYNADGSLDTGFGTGGSVTTVLSGSATAYAVEVQGRWQDRCCRVCAERRDR